MWTSPRTIGLLYFVTGMLFLFLGFCVILVIRWQWAYPGTPFLGLTALFGEHAPRMPKGVPTPDFYNQLVAIHGTLMIFFGIVPVLVGGFGSYVVPRLLGVTRLPFPRISLVGFLFFFMGGLFLIIGLCRPALAPKAGWTGYPPLATLEGQGQTLWLLALVCAYVSSLVLSITLLVLVLKRHAEGYSLLRMPFLVWTQAASAFLLLLSFPPLAAAAVLQLSDQLLRTGFFLPSGLVIGGRILEHAGGGSPILWQHLFWFLAHPEVYVMLLPALGIIAHIYTDHTRQPLWGYRECVVAVMGMAIISLLVWAHHMYLTGMGVALSAFFQATTLLVSVPSIVIGSALLMTLWAGRFSITPAMAYALAFLPAFGIGGFTGLPLALALSNIALHDTLYVVGHFHMLVAPGTLIAIFAGMTHWFPAVTGRRLNSRLAYAHFVLSFSAMLGIFLPMLAQGIAGIPRRMYDGGASYTFAQPWLSWHRYATFSAFFLFLVQGLLLVNLILTLRRGKTDCAVPEAEDITTGAHKEDKPSVQHVDAHAMGALFMTAANFMYFGSLLSAFAFLRTSGALVPQSMNAMEFLMEAAFLLTAAAAVVYFFCGVRTGRVVFLHAGRFIGSLAVLLLAVRAGWDFLATVESSDLYTAWLRVWRVSLLIYLILLVAYVWATPLPRAARNALVHHTCVFMTALVGCIAAAF